MENKVEEPYCLQDFDRAIAFSFPENKSFLVNYFCCVCYQPSPVLENGTSFCESHAKEHDHGRGKTLCQMTDEFKEVN